MTPAPALVPHPPRRRPPAGGSPSPREHRPGGGVTVLTCHMPDRHAATVPCRLGIPAAEPDGCNGIAAVTAAALAAPLRELAAPAPLQVISA